MEKVVSADRKEQDRARFLSLWKRIAPDSDPESIYQILVSAYEDDSRKYHNLKHIQNCLDELSSVRQLCEDADAVETALWFHDVVYDTDFSDNEEKSADFAFEQLINGGADIKFAQKVKDLILATKHNKKQTVIDFQLTVDIDLTSLAIPFDEFTRNTDLIGLEYGKIPPEKFKQGRVIFLKNMLPPVRERIYFSQYFFDKYETKARENLKKSIEMLSK